MKTIGTMSAVILLFLLLSCSTETKKSPSAPPTFITFPKDAAPQSRSGESLEVTYKDPQSFMTQSTHTEIEDLAARAAYAGAQVGKRCARENKEDADIDICIRKKIKEAGLRTLPK